MKNKDLLSIILLTLGGTLFSGYLSYIELYKTAPALSCGGGFSMFGYPSCVFGFLFFFITLIVSIFAYHKRK